MKCNVICNTRKAERKENAACISMQFVSVSYIYFAVLILFSIFLSGKDLGFFLVAEIFEIVLNLYRLQVQFQVYLCCCSVCRQFNFYSVLTFKQCLLLLHAGLS